MDEEQLDKENERTTKSNKLRNTNEFRKRLSKAVKDNAVKKSLIHAMMPIIAGVFFTILAIIIIIGVVVFILTLPGMVIDKLKDIAESVGNAIASFFGEDSTTQVNMQEVYDVLDYLEEMGYDLKGYGFLSESENENLVQENQYYDYDVGVIRDDSDDNIALARSAFVTNYLVSENYMYTIKNFNVTTEGFFGGLLAIGDHIASVFTDNLDNRRGMLVFYHEGSKGVGDISDNAYDAWERGSIKVDVKNKKLKIKRGWFNNSMQFSLDGWAGRYGIPLDFLLSVHIATMMPDLTVDIANSFDTEVKILLHEINNGSVDASFDTGSNDNESGSQYIRYDDFKDSAGWLHVSKKEAKEIMKKYGIKSQTSGKYACTGSNDPTITEYPSSLQGKNSTDAFNDVSQNQFMENDEALEADIEDGSYRSWKTLYEYLYDSGSGSNDNNHTFVCPGNGAHGKAFYVDELQNMVNELKEAWDKCNELSGDVQENPFNITKGPTFSALKNLDDYPEISFDQLRNGSKNEEFFAEIGTWTKKITDSEDPSEEEEIEYVLELRIKLTGLTFKDNWEYSIVAYRDMTDAELDEAGIDLSSDESNLCSNNTSEKACKHCQKYIKSIYKLLKKAHDDDFNTYIPYIANVTDHWYRNVYFIIDANNENENIVDYDYDYEAVMKERWTRYETYSNNPDDGDLYNPDKAGEFVYYVFDPEKSDGIGERYTGEVTAGERTVSNNELSPRTENINNDGSVENNEDDSNNSDNRQVRFASVGEDGTVVVKKAVTKKINDTDETGTTVGEDLNWNNLFDGVWSAYESDSNEVTTEWEQVYPDSNDPIKQNIYASATTSGNIVQTGEGQRTETNKKIKKMFLENTYFRYDGSAETADVIFELRKANKETLLKDNNSCFGALNNSRIKKDENTNKDESEYYKDIEKDGKKYSVADVSGQVSLEQDSLNAFSMLENEHTLDADYIYRDFKELIVELGYYKKEELTDETPKLLQWIVPDIGSYRYPDRTIDKRENEFGTMVHSKSDIDTNYKHTLSGLYEKISEMEEENPTQGNVPNTQNNSDNSSTSDNSQKTSQVNGIKNKDSYDVESNKNLNSVKGVSASVVYERVEESGEGYESVVQSGNVKYIHRYQGGQPYSNISFLWAGSTKTLGEAACGLFSCFNVLTGYGYDFDPNKDLPGFNWGATMDSVKTLMEEKGVPGQFVDSTDTAAVDAALNEGRPVILLFAANVTDKQGVCWTKGGHFVALVGKDKDGNILTLDSAAQGNVKRHDYPGTVDDMQPAFQVDNIWIADEAPSGSQKSGDIYEGYQGNEAVVSPVTGVLLEYGTYTDEEKDKDSVSGEQYRTNVDLKYGPSNYLSSENDSDDNNSNNTNSSNTNNNNSTNDNSDNQTDSKIVTDKVGYAKILVLDKESFKNLESSLGDKSDNVKNALKDNGKGENLLSSNGNYMDISNLSEEITKTWNDVDKTLYGYKEFAESYEKSGLSGYVVYIDGFKCELPDEEFDIKNKDSEKPSGKELTTESFKKVTKDSFDSDGKLIANEDNIIESKYEKEDKYKMASKKATNKLNAESVVKNDANSTIYCNDITLIKEGTVIGRTLTDKEIVEDYGDGARGDYSDYIKNENLSEEDTSKLIGNYLRIIMRDLDQTVVENVEDYMKLDDGTDKKEDTDIDWEFWYFSPYEGGGWDEEESGPEAVKDEEMYANNFDVGIIQWTTHPTLSPGGVQNFCKRAAEIDSSLCGGLAKYGNMSDSEVIIQSNRTQMQKDFTAICKKDRDKFTQVQIQIAKEDYLDVFCQNNNCEWLKDAPSVVQGTVMSAAVCNGPYAKISLTQGDDEGNIKAAINAIRSTKPALEPRLKTQESAALDILNKRVTTDEVETWVRKKESPANFNWGEGG